MQQANPSTKERALDELRSLGLLDSEPAERFNRVTRLTQRLLNVPSAAITLMDEDRSWYLSRQGLDNPATSREDSFCAHAILGTDIFQVADATKDQRFFNNPFVTGPSALRFYAGCPFAGPSLFWAPCACSTPGLESFPPTTCRAFAIWPAWSKARLLP
ncbi:MAG: domain/diguanylate cyclase protein [Acidimicrobiaceae bacterium]|nr:domain/diguanylate cyclase protein [Acidimicrobiaceae bacterium]